MDLLAAHEPYLPELAMCMCELCRAVDANRCSCALCLAGIPCGRVTPEGYYGAVSVRLRALVEGRHERVEWADHVATLPPLRGRGFTSFRIGRDDAVEGLGIGLSSHRRRGK